MYDWYKIKRQKDITEEEEEAKKIAFKQFDILQNEILPQMGFANIITSRGYESDDTIAKTVIDHIGNFVVITADEDLFQLLNINTLMLIINK